MANSKLLLDVLIVLAVLGAVVVLSFPVYLVARMNLNARVTQQAREDIAALKAHVGVLLKTLGVDVQEITREVAPGRTISTYELKGDLEAQFGMAAVVSSRLSPGLPQGARERAYLAGRTPLPQPTPSPAYADSWPPASPPEHAAVGLGYGVAAPRSGGYGSHGPASQRRMSGAPGPNSRGLQQQNGGAY